MEEKVARNLWNGFYPSFKAAFDANPAFWDIEKSLVVEKAKKMGDKSAENAIAKSANKILWNAHAEPAVHEVIVQSKEAHGDTRWCS
jgi:hypothetical protein